MSSAPGPPNAAVPPRNNSFNVPFPRANNTTKFNLSRRLPTAAASSSSTSASNNKAPLVVVPGRRIQAPHTNTMGALPPARPRNVKFDQMFYTSPLPRSISKAYNDLQAAGGAAATGGTAMVSSTLRTGVMTAGAVVPRRAAASQGVVAARSSPRGKVAAAAKTQNMVGMAVATRTTPKATMTTIAVPAAKKESLTIPTTEPEPESESESESEPEPEPEAAEPDRAVSGEPQSLAELATQPEKEVVDVANKDIAIEAQTTAAAEKDSPVPAPSSKNDMAVEAPTTVAAEKDSPDPAPPAVRSFAEAWAEEDDAFMKDFSDDDKDWHPLARGESTIKANKNTQAASVHVVEQGVKRANSSSSRLKRVVKTAAASSPGQTRTRVALGGRTQPTRAGRLSALGKRTAKRNENKVAATTRGISKQRQENKAEKRKAQSGHSAQQKSNRMANVPVLPESTSPAAALKREGPLRSVLPGFQVPPGILAKTGSGWDPGSGRRLSRRVSAGIASSNIHAPSQSPSDTWNVRNIRSGRKLLRRASAGALSAPAIIPSPVSAPVEENETLAPADIPAPTEETPVRKTPKTPSSSAVEQEIPDSSVSTVTPAARRFTRNALANTNIEQAPDPDPPKIITSGKRPRSSHGEPQVLINTTTTATSRRSTRNTPTVFEKKTALSKFHHQDTPRSPLPPPPPPPPPLKKTRRSLRGSLDLAPSFTVEVEETPQKGLGRSRVIEETPQPPPKSNVKVVKQTPQQQQPRTTRASTRKKVNPEFEFSDGEQA